MIDEYLAVDVLRGQWPQGLPDDDLFGQRFATIAADLGITITEVMRITVIIETTGFYSGRCRATPGHPRHPAA